MTITQSISETGSPCLRPRTCMILRPGLPFRRTLVLAVERRIEIQFAHLRGKPICCNTSSRTGHATESNALAMSTLRSTEGNFLQCSQRQANYTALKFVSKNYTALKLSWMDRSLINALWLGATILLSMGASRLARHLELAEAMHESNWPVILRRVGASFLRSRIMSVSLRRWKLLESSD